jgi:hypothetical protein
MSVLVNICQCVTYAYSLGALRQRLTHSRTKLEGCLSRDKLGDVVFRPELVEEQFAVIKENRR